MASNLDIGAVQSSGLPSIGAVQAAGGSTPVNEILTDTLSLSDSLVLGIGLQLVDTLTLSDSVQVITPLTSVTINDSSWVNVLTDSQQYLIGYWLPFSDTLTLSDYLLLSIGMAIADGFTFSDALAIFLGVPVVLSDTFTFSDATAVQLYGVLNETFSDTLTFSDSVIVRTISHLTININISPPAGDIQMNTGGGAYPELPPDIFSFGDTLQLCRNDYMTFSDTLTLSDSVIVHLVVPIALNITLSDTFTFLDSQNYSAAYSPAFSDTLALSDSVIVQILPSPINLSFGDSLELSDSIGQLVVDRVIIASFQDSLFLSDSVIVQVGQSLNSYLRRYLNDVTI